MRHGSIELELALVTFHVSCLGYSFFSSSFMEIELTCNIVVKCPT